MVSFQKMEDDEGKKTVKVVLHGHDVDIQDKEYISFSLSRDKKLGKDLVYVCNSEKIRKYYRRTNATGDYEYLEEVSGTTK